MTALELLAPARNASIGIAAVNCGADAVYIAGPSFGARMNAGNPISEVRELCDYAHRFGVKVFLTVNIELQEEELEQAHSLMLEAQDAGVDAFIIRDARLCLFDDITVPLHASTQCSIRSVQRALEMEAAGCSRIVLERELPLDMVRQICSAVHCEVEFFVHGALCVCYSGECRLSQSLSGRSADRGECIQACRSLYDLVDESGRVLVRGKALLSLKDLNLLDRLEELSAAGVMSFKIEGRLKNESYVKNVVREYSDALDALVSTGRYRRSSWGHTVRSFTPDSHKTFNRGYTQLYLDGKRGRWSSMDIPKSIGEKVGVVAAVSNTVPCVLELASLGKGVTLHSGDGFAFACSGGVTGFRADKAEGRRIICKQVPGLKRGVTLFRNISAEFEKTLSAPCRREIDASVDVSLRSGVLHLRAVSEDGREALLEKDLSSLPVALNAGRTEDMLRSGLSKRSLEYAFRVERLDVEGDLPLLSSAAINEIRNALAASFPGMRREKRSIGSVVVSPEPAKNDELMRSKYCIRYELGLCPVHQGAKPTEPLYLLNNGRSYRLLFDCARCEMAVMASSRTFPKFSSQ